MIMEPAFAVSPLYSLIPRYCGFESRPLLVEPPLFLWATALLLNKQPATYGSPVLYQANELDSTPPIATSITLI